MYYNSWDESCKKPFGACNTESTVVFKFKAEEVANINLVLYNETQKLKFKMNKQDTSNAYTYIWQTSEYPSLWWYYFEITMDYKTIYFGNNDQRLGGIGKIYESNPIPYQITLFKIDFKVPNWYKEGIIYQIFVDRFCDSKNQVDVASQRPSTFFKRGWNENPGYIKDEKGKVIKFDYFGGNIKGIIKKLPYIKSLGVSILYLNPIFEAWSNHKYDTADYLKIDSMYGDESDFSNLIYESRKIGINIILDGVFNHTGFDSIYFNGESNYNSLGAYNSKESPYYGWYMFDKYPHKYSSWWGMENMPAINKNSLDYRNFIMHGEESVIHHWMEKGVKGWRLDVVDELPENFVSELRQEVKTIDNQSVLLGEVWEDASNKISYGVTRKYLLGQELDSVMNYPFRKIVLSFIKGEISGEKCFMEFMSLYENYPKEYFYSTMNLLGSHDVPRLLTELKGDTNSKKSLEKLKMAVLFQMTFPGVPSIYYGDEVGLRGGSDPSNRGTYPWGNENNEILSWYLTVTKLRQAEPSLTRGEWIPLYGDQNVFSYLRCLENKYFIMLFNNDNNEHTISIPLNKYKFKNEYSDVLLCKTDKLISNKLVISISALGYRIIKLDTTQ